MDVSQARVDLGHACKGLCATQEAFKAKDLVSFAPWIRCGRKMNMQTGMTWAWSLWSALKTPR